MFNVCPVVNLENESFGVKINSFGVEVDLKNEVIDLDYDNMVYLQEPISNVGADAVSCWEYIVSCWAYLYDSCFHPMV
jgi:hypothetical protein